MSCPVEGEAGPSGGVVEEDDDEEEDGCCVVGRGGEATTGATLCVCVVVGVARESFLLFKSARR